MFLQDPRISLHLWGQSLADFFFPPLCPFCGQTQLKNLVNLPCSACLEQLKIFSHPRCPRCGLGFGSSLGDDHLCGECLGENRFFSRARAIGLYEGLLLEAISRFKYGGSSYLAQPLGKLLASYQDPEFSFREFDWVVPVPLHPQRLRQRGYNQALLLARRISREHRLPLDFQSLQRIRHTPPQTQLSGAERQKNIRGAFQVVHPDRMAERRVLLIDDVFTTGATVQECSRVLLHAGAKEVQVLTLARVSLALAGARGQTDCRA